TDAESDLYLRQGGATKLVSTGPSGGNGLFDTQFEGLSPDGTQVYFSTEESLVAADPDDVSRDLYVREGGDTRLLSTGPTATPAPFGQGFGAAMDGVAFFATQEALVAEDQDEASDVYRYEDGVATLVSTGTEDLFAAYRGASEDGEVVFFSTVEQLAAADDDGAEDIYARRGATTTLVSTGPEAGGDHFAEFLATTPDGSHAYFQTDEGLVAADDDGAPDIYERAGGVTTLVTTGPVTTSSPEDFEKFAVSDDGSRAFFVTQEHLVPGDLDGTVDLYERSAGKTTLITPGGDDAEYELAGLSADGARVLFGTDARMTAADADDAADVYASSVAPPRNVSVPVITGAPVVGLTLTCSRGAWAGAESFALAWRRDGAPIAGATTAAYRVAAADVRHSLTCSVTARNDGGATTATSPPVAIPAPAAPPPGLLPVACANAQDGTRAADRLSGTAAGDLLRGLRGDDVLRGLGGADCLRGGGGDDRLAGGGGKDTLAGGGGDDRLVGGKGKDVLEGGKGDDRLAGGAGVERFDGGAGRDVIAARDGRRETVRCGRGRDRVTADERDRTIGCERVRRR
ncbi:MAG: hypothetical protein ABW081_03350, partial [Solirubrobacteraceae bacterium]